MWLWSRCLQQYLVFQDLISFYIIDQDDYNSKSLNVTFSPDESEKTVQVSIINDFSRENSESFFGYLMITHQSEFLPQSAGAVIEISFNDCKM